MCPVLPLLPTCPHHYRVHHFVSGPRYYTYLPPQLPAASFRLRSFRYYTYVPQLLLYLPAATTTIPTCRHRSAASFRLRLPATGCLLPPWTTIPTCCHRSAASFRVSGYRLQAAYYHSSNYHSSEQAAYYGSQPSLDGWSHYMSITTPYLESQCVGKHNFKHSLMCNLLHSLIRLS